MKTSPEPAHGRKANTKRELTALESAVRLLSRSDRFEREVRSHLAQFSPEEVDAAIERLKAQNILNDERAAESFCRIKSGRKSIGAYRLAFELRQKGASEELIAKYCGSQDDSVRATELLTGKFRPHPEQQQKAFRFLLSRGFDYDTAHRAVRDFFESDV